MHLIKIKILILFNEQYFHHINRDKINLFLKQICILLSADNIYIYIHICSETLLHLLTFI